MRLITILPGDASAVPDTVPVDHTVNGLISSGARFLAQHKRNLGPMPTEIYQIGICDYLTDYEVGRSFEAWSNSCVIKTTATDPSPPSTLKKIQNRTQSKAWSIAGQQKFRIKFIPNDRWFWVEFFIRYDLPFFILWPFSHFIPSISKSVHLLSKGRRKLAKFLDVYDFFLRGAWIFDTSRTRCLWRSLDESSQLRFDFNGENFDMMSYQIHSANCCVEYFRVENEKKRKENPNRGKRALKEFKEARKRLMSIIALITPILSLLLYTYMLAQQPTHYIA